MYINFNPRTMGLNARPFEEILPAAKAAGFQGIEVPAHCFSSVEAAREAGKRLEDIGMRWGLMMAPCDMFKVDDAEFDRALAQWARWLERARASGCSRAYNHFWPGSDERTYEENFEWHHNRLTQIWHIMKENGFSYGLEFMGAETVMKSFRYPFARTISGTMALADSVSHEIGFVFDTIHWYTSGMSEDDLRLFLENMDRIVNLHLDDAYPGRERNEQIDRERAMPNESGVIDSTRIVRLFEERGYDGPVMVEPMAPTTVRWESMNAFDVAAEAAANLKQVFLEACASAK
ncbi:MAG: sugar phosphate isomerase/epimerase [Lachnospiraceae bacterium]|nr:sugar phosphate isomerase/epimerase [Lachnospiraceae bacterium]